MANWIMGDVSLNHLEGFQVRWLDDSGAWFTGIHGWVGLMGYEGVARVVYQKEATSRVYT